MGVSQALREAYANLTKSVDPYPIPASPLHRAIEKENMLEQDSIPASPLHRAIEKENMLEQDSVDSSTPSHHACKRGNVSLVRTLICEYKADVTARDSHDNTPLHVAAFNGKEEVVLALIKEFGCDINVKGNGGRSLLHSACQGGNVSLARTLINQEFMSLLVRDINGETPLHIFSSQNYIDCVEELLLANAPLLVRNNLGKTPVDVAVIGVKSLFSTYVRDNRHKLRVDYGVIEKHAKKVYSGAHPIIRHPGAGKSIPLLNLSRGKDILIHFGE